MIQLKNTFFLCLLFLQVSPVLAQSFNLELEQMRVGEELVVEVFIQKTDGSDFELGSASFPFANLYGSLDLAHAKKVDSLDGDFSNLKNNEGYSSFYLVAQNNWLHLVLLKNFDISNNQGSLVTAERKRVAQFTIPIIDKCANVQLQWLVNSGTAITNFDGSDVTANVNYVGPAAYKLTADLAIPYIIEDGDDLYTLVAADSYTWFRDGVEVVGNDSELKNAMPGEYEVTVSNECETKTSTPYRVEKITAIDEASGLETGLVAYPNPYEETTFIQYSLNNSANVLVEIYDLLGNKIVTLVNDNQSRGVYTLPFSATENGYEPGVYVIKVQAGETALSQRIVELGH